MTRTTDKFFEIVESTFSIDEITPEKIMDEFYSGSFTKVKAGKDRAGKQRYQKSKATISGQSIFRGLAERLSEGREIYEEIDIEKDYDKLRDLRRRAKDLDIYSKEVTEKAEDKMKVISEEIVEITEERREERIKEIEEEKEEKRLEERKISIAKDIDAIEDLRDLDNVKKRVKKLAKKVDVSDLESRLEEIRIGLELQREEEKAERTRIMREQQEASRLEKERLRAEGIEPDLT